MDLHSLSDEELANCLNDILNEQERRATLANTAIQVEQLTTRYVSNGGNASDLESAVVRGRDAIASSTQEALPLE